ncbi:MAG TPA: hypothetical protein VFI25_19785 [Planctomycetota bacterium]|jgi:hypothetical protein|nr:hypothetical protein [Planctomycetota bacterium]
MGRGWFFRWKRRADVRALALDPTPERYAALSRDLAAEGIHGEAAALAAEGFARFPDSHELRSLYLSARTLDLERQRRRRRGRARGALCADLVGLHLAAGDLRAASAVAEERVSEAAEDSQARLALARVKLARFQATQAAGDGLEALSLLEGIGEGDGAAALRLLAELAAEVGAWRAAHLYVARWRALAPNDPAAMRLQARLAAHRGEPSPDLPSAIRRATAQRRTGEGDVALAPALERLARSEGVEHATHARVGLGGGPGARSASAPERWLREVAETGMRTIVRVGLGDPTSVVVGGPASAVLVGFGPAGAAVAECRGLEAAHRAEGSAIEAVAGGTAS